MSVMLECVECAKDAFLRVVMFSTQGNAKCTIKSCRLSKTPSITLSLHYIYIHISFCRTIVSPFNNSCTSFSKSATYNQKLNQRIIVDLKICDDIPLIYIEHYYHSNQYSAAMTFGIFEKNLINIKFVQLYHSTYFLCQKSSDCRLLVF